MPSPPGWPVRLKTGLHPFRDEASISAQCGHQNRKQSASKARRIIQRRIQYFSISKQLSFPAVERNIPQQVLQIENRMLKITTGCSCNGLKLEAKKVKSRLPYLCEICWTPRNRGYFLTVALQHHGGMCRIRNL